MLTTTTSASGSPGRRIGGSTSSSRVRPAPMPTVRPSPALPPSRCTTAKHAMRGSWGSPARAPATSPSPVVRKPAPCRSAMKRCSRCAQRVARGLENLRVTPPHLPRLERRGAAGRSPVAGWRCLAHESCWCGVSGEGATHAGRSSRSAMACCACHPSHPCTKEGERPGCRMPRGTLPC